MPRALTSSDLLITRIEGKNYAYIKPEVGNFDADRTISDYTFSGNSQYGRLLLGSGDISVEQAVVSNAKMGVKIYGGADVRIYDYQYLDTQPTARHAVGIRLDTSHTGSAELLRLYGNGYDQPSKPTSGDLNTDFLTLNNQYGNAGTVYVRDVTTKNFADAGIDVKNEIFIMNATIGDSFRALKLYPNATVTIVNSEITSVKGGEQAQLWGTDTRIYHYNTTWDGKFTHDPSKIGVSDAPARMRESIKQNHIVQLKENPLPKIDDFFTVDDAQYKAQVSVNGGRWIDLDLPNNGYLSTAIGDTLIELPNLGAGSYQMRAWTVEDGKTSAVATSATFNLKGGAFVAQQGTGGTTATSKKDDDAQPPIADDDEVVALPPASGGTETVNRGAPQAGGGVVLTAGNGDQLLITSAGDDRVTSGHGNDLILFDTSQDIGDDVMTDFNRGRDKLLFTEFVDLGPTATLRLDGRGRFDLDDPALDANGGSIAFGSALANRFIHYAGETEDGLFMYEIWNRPWSEIG